MSSKILIIAALIAIVVAEVPIPAKDEIDDKSRSVRGLPVTPEKFSLGPLVSMAVSKLKSAVDTGNQGPNVPGKRFELFPSGEKSGWWKLLTLLRNCLCAGSSCDRPEKKIGKSNIMERLANAVPPAQPPAPTPNPKISAMELINIIARMIAKLL